MTDNKARAQLYGKIAAVTAAVDRIPKNGFNNFFKYKYATESDITDGLRELLNTNGLAFLPPSVLAWERSATVKKDGSPGDDLTRVQMQFELACTDTGEVYTSQMWGEGQDSGDKGFYKAYTGAVKYFLMKTFLIATGDDPEQDTHQQQSGASFNQQRQQQPQAPRPPAPQAAPATNGSAPICPVHNKPMRTGSKGGYFCATKIGTDEQGKDMWCKARPEKPAPAERPDTSEWDEIDNAPSVRRRGVVVEESLPL